MQSEGSYDTDSSNDSGSYSQEDPDIKLKRSLMKYDLSNSKHGFIAYLDYTNTEISLYSISTHMRMPIGAVNPGVDDEKDFQYGVVPDMTYDCELKLGPDPNYLLASLYYSDSERATLDLMGLKKPFDRDRIEIERFMDPNIRLRSLHQIENEDNDSRTCEIATHGARNLIAAFPKKKVCKYQLWTVNETPFTRLTCLRKTQWNLETSEKKSRLRSLAFNSTGEYIAGLHDHNLLTIAKVDTNEVLLADKIEKSARFKSGVPAGYCCRWRSPMKSSSADEHIVAVVEESSNLYDYDVEKSHLLKIIGERLFIRVIDVHPKNHNIVAIGRNQGELYQYDFREPGNAASFICDHDLFELNPDDEKQRLQWHPTDDNLVLYLRGGSLALIDSRKSNKSLEVVCSDIADATFYYN